MMVLHLLLSRGVIIISSWAVPASAFAQNDRLTPVAEQLLVLSRVLVSVVFLFAVVAFGWGLVKFIIAAGNPEEIKKAKSFLLWGVVGMAIGASIFGVVAFIRTYIGLADGRLIIMPPAVQ